MLTLYAWVTGDSSVTMHCYREQMYALLHQVNMINCVQVPAVLETGPAGTRPSRQSLQQVSVPHC